MRVLCDIHNGILPAKYDTDLAELRVVNSASNPKEGLWGWHSRKSEGRSTKKLGKNAVDHDRHHPSMWVDYGISRITMSVSKKFSYTIFLEDVKFSNTESSIPPSFEDRWE